MAVDFNGADNWTLKRWTEQDFHANKAEWDALLGRSDADPLFLSWPWLNHWWRERKRPHFKLCIFAIYSEGTLLGLAPLYIEKDSYARGVLRTRRLQFIGKSLSSGSGIRSEYMGFIAHRGYEQPVIERLLAAIVQESSWSELALYDVDNSGALYKEMQSWSAARRYHERHEHAGSTYVVDCRNNFADYLAELGPNTRLKLFNRRKVLEQHGQIELVPLSHETWDTLIEHMSLWHQKRWDDNGFGNKSLAFLRDVTSMQALQDSSLLMLNGVPVSVMVNVRSGTTVYNIQLAFKDDLDKRISLGTLHLGYVIEQLFLDPSVEEFDLLEGTGKNSNYKSRIAQEGAMLESVRLIRSRPLKWIFQIYDRYFRT